MLLVTLWYVIPGNLNPTLWGTGVSSLSLSMQWGDSFVDSNPNLWLPFCLKNEKLKKSGCAEVVVSVLASHCCDKIPEINDLKREKNHFGSGFTGSSSWSLWKCCLGLWWGWALWQRKLLTSWQPGSKRRACKPLLQHPLSSGSVNGLVCWFVRGVMIHSPPEAPPVNTTASWTKPFMHELLVDI